MNIDITIALCCAAISAAVLSFVAVKAMLGAADGARQAGASIRSILAPVAILVSRRRVLDPELNRTLERLEKLDRDETCAFSLREYTPSGWNEDANSMLSVLRKRGVVSFSMYYKTDEPESLCVASMTPSRLSVLSDVLPGRYLVRLADEEELAPYDGFIRFTPEGEVLAE